MAYEIPEDLLYTESHEWARISENQATVGITSYAVEQMDKEIVNVELPEKGAEVQKGDSFGVVDSVKAAFDLYSPLSGEIISVNDPVSESPEIVAEDPYDKGWLIKIRIFTPDEADQLMNASEYKSFIESQE